MKGRQIISGLWASIGMLVLIIDGKTAAEGARMGLDLCMKTVIPSLFPFFVLSTVLTASLNGISLSLIRPLGKLCRIPEGTEFILLSGFLGGYPVGAQCISAAYHADQIKKGDAEYILAFCNNAGPAFVFGIIGPMFPHIGYAWLLWGIHIVSALLASTWFPRRNTAAGTLPKPADTSLAAALHSAVRIMATVCGWIILFRVLLVFLTRWVFWIFPIELQVLLTGVLELANGCCRLSSIAELPIRFSVCSVMLAFGGLCVSMQTVSVTQGLSLRKYAAGKILQCLYSLAFCIGIFYSIWGPVCAVLLAVLQNNRKKSSFQQMIRV